MGRDTLKTIITVAVLIIAFMIAISVLSWAVRVLLPIAIIVVAGYIVYKLFARGRV